MIDAQTQSLATNPYVGPRTFGEQEQALFFGRDREAEDLRSLVLSEQVVLFYAQSGAGKSSLVNARLRPDLRTAGFQLLPTARVSGALTTDDVAGATNVFSLHLLIWLDENRHTTRDLYHQSLTDYLIGAGFIASRASPADDDLEDELAEAHGVQNATPVLLVIDQFEEMFTAHADKWEQRTAFFRQVRAALQAAPHLHLLLVMREDFVASLDPYLRWLPGRLQARYGMERLGPGAAEEAIAGPVAESAHPFAPGVARQLVDNLRLIRVQGQSAPQPGQYVEPVQLQVVCWQLWENLRQRPLGPITIDDLQEAGDVDLALADYYEQSLRQVQARLPGIVSDVALRDWFSRRLITESGTRGLVNQGESHTGGIPNTVVGVLDNERYLVRRESRAGSVWCELTHDRFVQPILEANRAWSERNRNPLTLAAQVWRAAGEPADQLYRDRQLTDAADLLAHTQEAFGDLERRFVAAGQAAEKRRKEQRQRLQTIATLLAILFLTGLTTWALWNANQARKAEGQAVIAQATAVAARAETEKLQRQIQADRIAQIASLTNIDTTLPQYPQRALLLAVEAAKLITPPVPTSLTILHDLLGRTGEKGFARHEDDVSSVAFSPDGQTLASGSWDNTIRLWSPANPNAEPVVLRGHEAAVFSIAFSPDGQTLASGSWDNTIRLWSLTDPSTEPLVLRGHEAAVFSVAFSPDGQTLASGSRDNTIRLWSLTDPSAEPLVLRGHEADIFSVAFSPDGQTLASGSGNYLFGGSYDNTIRLWSLTDPSADPQILRGHEADVSSVVFSPDGQTLASGSWDNTIRLWSLADLSAEPLVLRGHEADVSSVAFSPDGQMLASGRWDNTIRLWSLADPSAEPLVLRGHEADVSSVAFSPDGQTLASGSYDNTIRLWSLTDPSAEPLVLRGHEADVSSVAFSPDGQTLASGSYDNTIRLWSLADPSAEPIVLRGHEADVSSVAFSPDGQTLASGSYDNTIRLWSLTDPSTEPIVLRGHEADVSSVAFSPDGQTLASGSYDNTIRLWSLADPSAEPIVLRGHEAAISSVAFSPDGQTLASGSGDDTIRLWLLTDPSAEPLVLHGHEADVSSVVFSSDGQTLASSSWDNTIRLWSLTDPSADPQILRGHNDSVRSVVFAPDGTTLASGSLDGTIRLWSLADPSAEPIVLRGHEADVSSVVFSPDGQTLASGSRDTTIRLWRGSVTATLALACTTAGRNLRQDEWQYYFPEEPYRRTCPQWPAGE